jgi:Fur family zinc uptake transcriptional regulator
MNEHAHISPDLTKNQLLVMDALTKSDGPLSAYAILDQLSDQGFRAPQQVYRALEKLVDFDMVHRLECLNAFVACRHPGCEDHETLAFMICENCGQVSEITDNLLSKRLQHLAGSAHFALNKITIELRGMCSNCQAI